VVVDVQARPSSVRWPEPVVDDDQLLPSGPAPVVSRDQPRSPGSRVTVPALLRVVVPPSGPTWLPEWLHVAPWPVGITAVALDAAAPVIAASSAGAAATAPIVTATLRPSAGLHPLL